MTIKKPGRPCKAARLLLPLRLSFFMLGVSVAAMAEAQFVRPDAGQLLEQQRIVPLMPAPLETPSPAPATPAASPEEDVKIPVSQLRILGATAFSAESLHALVQEGEGRSLSLAALQALAARITHYYRERGYILAHALIPAQEPTDNVIDIRVLEGRIGEVSVTEQKIAGGAALAPLADLKSGDVAQIGNLERALLLLSDLPGMSVSSTLKPGSTQGTSDLQVDVTPGAWMTGRIDVDRNGDRFSGKNRIGTTLNFNNPLQLGDLASLQARASDEGMHFVHGSWQLPVNRYGTRMGISASTLHYALGDTLAPLGLKGDAKTVSLSVLHPLLRSRRANLNAEFSVDHSEMEDRVTASGVSINKRADVWNAGLSGDWLDRWQGSTAWSVKFTQGQLWLDKETAQIDAVSAGTAGSFSKWSWALRRLQALTTTTEVLLSVSGQLANKNLDSSQKMGLSGFYSVRAYPQGEAVGDQGYLATIELRHTLAFVQGWQGIVFADHGHIAISRQPWIVGNNSRTLTGAGTGLNYRGQHGWSFQTAIAWRIDSGKPLADQDRMPRLWLQIGREL